MLNLITRAITIKKIKQLKYTFKNNHVFDKEDSGKIIGILRKEGGIEILYPQSIDDLPYLERILNFKGDLRDLKIKYSGDYSKIVKSIDKQAMKLDKLRSKLYRK